MNKLCVIAVYFGPLPNYFGLWLRSAQYNPTIDFYVITDQAVSAHPQNVKIIPYTIAQMQKRATEVLGFAAALDTPYKCCDYKPMYGRIFEKYIQKYDYWGHCDLDMIFGDLQAYFDAYTLYQYDKFLALGHLSMYRNTPACNDRYREPGALRNYGVVYSHRENYAFDELDGVYRIYQKNHYPVFSQNIFADISAQYTRYRLIETYPLDRRTINYEQQMFYWENGKVYRDYYVNGVRNRDEFIYIHFKKRADYPVNFETMNIEAFYISPEGFAVKEGESYLADVERWNPYNSQVEKREMAAARRKNIAQRCKMVARTLYRGGRTL
jgi:hypothetical protein